jgi:hypothetical protein
MGGLESLTGRLASENIGDQEILNVEKFDHEMYRFYLRRQNTRVFSAQPIDSRKDRRGRVQRPVVRSLCQPRRSYPARPLFCQSRAPSGSLGEAMREHEAILDALRRQAGSELSDILVQHLRNKKEAAVAYLADATQRSC